MLIHSAKLQEAVRLKAETDLSNRQIGLQLGVSHMSINRLMRRMLKKGKKASELKSKTGIEIRKELGFGNFRLKSKRVPDWAYVHQQHGMPYVTLMLLWEEYRLANPDDALSYSQFTHHYRKFVNKLEPSLKKQYTAGSTVLVDYAGKTIPWINPKTGEVHQAQLFIGVLGYSNYTFVYASRSQKLPDWIDAHNKMFAFFSGTTEEIVPDNLKSAVTKAGREPIINRTYYEMAKHYKCFVNPARVKKPKDKASAEFGVLFTYRWICAVLRHRKFFSIEEINEAIRELLIRLNERPFKHLPGTRRSMFEESEKALLKPIMNGAFEYAEWTSFQKVPSNYHIRVNGHYYSVPYKTIGYKVEARSTVDTVEIFCSGERIAIHPLNRDVGKYTTKSEHQPKNHRIYTDATEGNMMVWAKKVGKHTRKVVKHQFETKSHPALALRVCSSLQRLAKQYGNTRVEAACKFALTIKSPTLTSIKSILARRIDQTGFDKRPVQVSLPLHHNVRGPEYYATGGV